MKAEFSELKLLDSSVLGCCFSAVISEDEKKTDINSIPVDIDVRTESEEEGVFSILLELNSNSKGKIEGCYSYSLLQQAIYTVENYESKPKEEIDSFLLFSAIPALINLARGFLANISSYSFYGKYTLPMIDLNDLIDKITSPAQENK